MKAERNTSLPAIAHSNGLLAALRTLCLATWCLAMGGTLLPDAANAAISYVSRGNTATGTTSLSVPYPGSIVAGNLLVLAVGNKYPTNGPTTPAGWTLVGQASGGLGGTGADSGQVYSTVFVKQAVGTESGNLAVTVTGGNTAMARMFQFSKAAGTSWDYAATTGTDNTAGNNWSVTGAANPGIITNDLVISASGINGNRVTAWTESIAATGATFGGTTEIQDASSGTGDDMAQIAAWNLVTAGTATAAPVYTMTGASGTANTTSPTGGTVMLRIRETVTALATGTDPAATTIAPGAAATDVDQFTLQTTGGTETIASVTVNLSTNTGVGRLAITNSANTELGFTTSPVSGANIITVAGMSATTTLTTFKVRVTPLSHAAMPAVPGAAYAITAPVTSWVGGGTHAHTGSDTNTNALTIDNASPSNATASSGSAGDAQTTLSWTTSASTDFSRSVVLRWTGASAGAEVPAEGTDYANGNSITTATVVCVRTADAASTAVSGADGAGSGGCSATALTNGTTYTYKVFQKDANGNYDAGISIGSFTPRLTAPTVTKSFAASSMGVGGTSTLTVTITNPNTTAINGLTFTDTYPSTNLKNAPTPALSNTCGGTATATAGASVLSLSGGTLAGSSSCSVTVSVTSTVVGSYVNSTGAVTSTNASSGTAATATLTVTALTCFTDNFNRADGAPAGNWAVANEGGTFGNPKIVSNRLRLTDATNSVSTMAALQQLFPAAGNKIVVEFDHYAYNGNGADGIGVVLSDASVAPVPGAFGGSLGYAQKQVSAGGDTTHPGFAGGWIGLALDEFGNFSANTEGRSGGSAPGLRIDSVAIRGSGSSYTGYPYHRGTATLTPGVDLAGATAAPGYRYRITIDHTNGVNAFTSVERDTGSGYTTLIAAYDAKAEAGQAAVPTNWYLSFTGSTGGSTNIHEIDNLQVCSTNPQPLPALDHLRLLHDTAALTCAAETVTIKACADAACNTLYLGSVTADLTNIAGATWSSDPVTFTGGQTSITLTKATAGAVTLGAVAVPAVNATRCFNGATETCTLTYTASSACFDTAETGANPSTPIYTKLAGTAFSLDVLATSGGAVNSGYIGTIAVDLVDPTAGSGNCSDTNTGLTPAVNYTFTSVNAGRRTYSFNYPYAAANVKVRIRDTAANQPACSADNFAIRPLQFALSTTTALNPAANTLAAGANFNLTANPGAAVTQGYTGTPVVDTTGIVDHNTAAIAAAAWAGNFTATASPGGGSLASNFQYHDVGTITLNADAVRDANFTAVDQVTGIVGGVDHGANGDCVAGSTTNTIAAGKYGCRIGSTALGPLGRFKVDHFDLTAQFTAATCGAGTANEFTYMDHDALGLNLRLLAKSSNGTTLSRYTAGYASLGTLAITGDNGGAAVALSRLSQPALAAVAWTSGGYSSAATLPETHRFDGRNVAPTPIMDGPYDSFRIKVVVGDPDNAKVTALNGAAYTQTNATDPVFSPTTKIRYGRLRLLNAYGSDLLPIRVPVRAEYFNGSGWTTNTADSCTTLPNQRNNLAIGNQTGTLTAANYGSAKVPAAALTLGSGLGDIILAAPAAGTIGSVDIALNLGATAGDANCVGVGFPAATAGTSQTWLRGNWCGAAGNVRDPNARIKFGSPKAPYLYLRERY